MKRYKVTGKDKNTLLIKVAEKLKTDVSMIAHKVIEDSNEKVVLEVWIKDNTVSTKNKAEIKEAIINNENKETIINRDKLKK